MKPAEKTIAQIVAAAPQAAAIFAAYQIDPKSDGERTVEVACGMRGMDPVPLRAALAHAGDRDANQHADAFRDLSTADLVAKIVAVHHVYLRSALPRIRDLCAATVRRHGDRDTRLYELQRSLTEFQERIELHLEAEEHVLFPAFIAHEPDPAMLRHDVALSMYEDHEFVDATLRTWRTLLDGFTAPAWADDDHRALLAELHALERDTRRHVHVENSVLMVRFLSAPWRGPAGPQKP
jgi:regulator of cell morphogenesis and NO signaling